MADSQNVEQLQQSLACASQYPRKCFGVEGQQHTIAALEGQLNKRASKLFSRDGNIHFLEVYRTDEDPYHTRLSNAAELERHLLQSIAQRRPDPRQRYIFIHASDSREPLKTTRQMLFQILTYHQVVPGFLEFIFPFGKMAYERDSYFSGFRSDSLHRRPRRSLQIGEPLNRSGKQIELCYHLKSVERSSTSWAIRQCSVYHKFDLVSHQSTWIIVKANSLMRQVVDQQLRDHDAQIVSEKDGSECSALARTLMVHRSICSWTGDNWHWYIDELEFRLADETRDIMSSPLENMASGGILLDNAMMNQAPLPNQHLPGDLEQQSPQRPERFFTRALRRTTSIFTWKDDHTTLQNSSTIDMTDVPQPVVQPGVDIPVENFKIERIREIQDLEDETNKAILILKANCRVLQNIQREYDSLASANDFTSKRCESEFDSFQHHLGTIVNDLEMLQPRLETLLRKAADRKSLIQQVLQYFSSLRGQDTAESMEQMTRQMHRMTEKTVQQTASMNIITFVTLLFLPGTFISTLMSTPIVNFSEPTSGFSLKNIGVGALQLYLVVSLPLLCLTVLLWVAWYLKERKSHGKKLSGEEWHQEYR